jgi:hypothetical protein
MVQKIWDVSFEFKECYLFLWILRNLAEFYQQLEWMYCSIFRWQIAKCPFLISCDSYSSTAVMEAVYLFEAPVICWTTQPYVLEDSLNCENIKSDFSVFPKLFWFCPFDDTLLKSVVCGMVYNDWVENLWNIYWVALIFLLWEKLTPMWSSGQSSWLWI